MRLIADLPKKYKADAQEQDVVGFWKPSKFEETIKIGNTIINNNDYVLADIDGVVIIPSDIIEDILNRSEKYLMMLFQ